MCRFKLTRMLLLVPLLCACVFSGYCSKAEAAVTRLNLVTYLDNVDAWAYPGDSTADLAIDGKAKTRWETNTTASEFFPCTLTVDLGDVYSFSKISAVGSSSGKKYYTISISDDGSDWTVVQSGAKTPNGLVKPPKETLTAEYVKFEVFGGKKEVSLGDMKITSNSKQVPLQPSMFFLGSGMLTALALMRRSLG